VGFSLGGLFMGFLPQNVMAASSLTHGSSKFLKVYIVLFG
jgi:hypothetical protein